MHINPRASCRRASFVAALWSILLLLQRLPWLAAAAAAAGRASPNDGGEEQAGGDEQTPGGDESASATGAERSEQQQQLGRRPARIRRFLTRARQTTSVMVTSSTGYNLAINDDKQVYGVASDNSPYGRSLLLYLHPFSLLSFLPPSLSTLSLPSSFPTSILNFSSTCIFYPSLTLSVCLSLARTHTHARTYTHTHSLPRTCSRCI